MTNEKPFATGQSSFHISTTAFARAPSGVRKDSAGFDVGVTSVNVVHSVAICLLPWPALRLSDFFLRGFCCLFFLPDWVLLSSLGIL